jgi:23S rRNA pseudouridine2605 synthase
LIRTFQPSAARRKPARADKPEMTLDRALSRAGMASRTVAAQWIAAGRVRVDGRVARDPQLWVAPERQRLTLDGQPLRRPRPMYWALHKPVGYITSHGDPRGRPTIYDLVGPQLEMPAWGDGDPRPASSAAQEKRDARHSRAGARAGKCSGGDPSPASSAAREKRDARRSRAGARANQWYFSVGRLDQDTSGLLLITNDSVFAERIANPELKVAKTYHVRVAPPMDAATLARLGGGLDIGRGERAAPCPVRALQRPGWIEIVLREGKNRQVRRMVEAVGHRVEELVRVRIGKLALGDLPSGKLRRIRPGDVI